MTNARAAHRLAATAGHLRAGLAAADELVVYPGYVEVEEVEGWGAPQTPPPPLRGAVGRGRCHHALRTFDGNPLLCMAAESESATLAQAQRRASTSRARGSRSAIAMGWRVIQLIETI